jgi:HD-GYP domain-containing protein (c-di-GMP phosphodiesterase class II)
MKIKVVPLEPDALRVGRTLPYALRDSAGSVLLPQGAAIADQKQLALLLARELFVEESDSAAFQRSYLGQLDHMVRLDTPLGRIADTKPTFDASVLPAQAPRKAKPSVLLSWPDLQMRLRLLLVDARGADWIPRLRELRDDVMAQVDRHPDRALCRLIEAASTDFHDYSANHSLLASIICHLAAPQVPGWNAAWDDALTLAALSMNVSLTRIQDDLSRQTTRLTEIQRMVLNEHPGRSVTLLQRLGVSDPMWLHAVLHHHDAPAGPAAGRSPGELMARLIRRADGYLARLSPRKSRAAMSATAAAQAAFFDEGGHQDEIGQALVKTLGLYPPGSWVKLACNETALVMHRQSFANQPLVISLVGKTGLPLAVPAVRYTRSPEFAVTASLAPSLVKVRPNIDELDKMI